MVLAVSTASAASSPIPSAAKPAALTSDFETFLRMLTAQARFQDPLEPIDSTEYAAQLAQFSMVEQQVLTNDTLQALLAHMGLQNPASLAAWVGMEARVVAPVAFDGRPVTIAPEVAPGASAATLVVLTESGSEVQRLRLPLQPGTLEWAGVDDSGRPFPAGIYRFEVESLSNGTVIRTEPVAVYARVTETQLREGAVVLILEGGQAVPAEAATGLREPV